MLSISLSIYELILVNDISGPIFRQWWNKSLSTYLSNQLFRNPYIADKTRSILHNYILI